MNILIVSPHPDDAEIGCGSIIAKMVDLGHSCTIGVCTGEGDLTMVHSGNTIPFSMRVSEQKESAVILGCNVLFFNLAPASKFDTFPIAHFVSMFDKHYHKYDVVILPLPCAAEDHNVVYNASMAAMRQGKTDSVSYYCYEQPTQSNGLGKLYIPVSKDNLMKKLSAIEAHKSQFASRGKGIYSSAALKALATVRGSECGNDFAEILYFVRGKHESII